MKKLITAMVAAVTLTMSLSAKNNMCSNISSSFNYNDAVHSTIKPKESNLIKTLNINMKNLLTDYHLAETKKTSSPPTRLARTRVMERISKDVGVSTQLEILTSSGAKYIFDAMAIVSANDNYIEYLLRNFKDDNYMFFKYFVFTTKPSKLFYGVIDKQYGLGAGDLEPIAEQFMYSILFDGDDYRTISSYWKVIDSIARPVISDNRLSYFNLDYQDFLYAILSKDYKTADKIISSDKNFASDEDLFIVIDICK